MTVNTNIIKTTAKTSLKGNWVKASISCLVLVFAVVFNNYISSLIATVFGEIFSAIIYYSFIILMVFPLFFGVLRYFWRMTSDCDDNPISVFYYFSDISEYLKTLKFELRFGLKILPIAVIVFVPAVIVWLISQNYIFDLFNIPIPLWTRNLELAIIFSKTLSNILLAIFSLRYYIAPILFVANEKLDIDESLYMSTVISKKTSLDFVYLIISFLGWLFISLFAIPLVFTLPYMIISYVIHVRFAVAEYNNHIESKVMDDYPTFSVGV